MFGVSNYTNYATAGSPDWKLGQTPNWRGGAFDGWRHARSTFAVDFRRNQAMRDEDNVIAEICIGVSRDSPRILNSNDGFLQTFGANEPARSDGFGLFVGGEFVNKIRNPRAEGGVVGTSSLPTNWSNVSGGLITTFLGDGVEDGLPYADIHFAGMASGWTQIQFDTGVATTAGQAWGLDFGIRLISGTAVGVSPALKVYTSAPSFLANKFLASAVVPNSTRQTVSGKVVFHETPAANSRPFMQIPTIASVSYDFALRIYAPKLVQLDVVEGPELVTNGSLSDASGWVLSNCTIADGSMTFNDAGALMSGSRVAAAALFAGAVYAVTFDLAAISGDGVSPYVGGTQGDTYNTAGAKTSYIASATSTQTIGIISSGANNFVGSVDNISVKMISPGYMPDFPILPQAGLVAESVCMADNVMATVPELLAGFDASAGMSELVAVDLSQTAVGVVRPLFEISDGTEGNSIQAYIDEDDQPTLRIVSGGGVQVTAVLAYPVLAGTSLLAFGWGADGGYIVDQSGQVVAFAAVTLPSVLDHLQFGGDISSNYLNDTLVQMQTCSLLSLDEVQSWIEHAEV